MSSMIKVYKSTDTGARMLSGQAGSLIPVLDDVLVNGYSSSTISTITKTDNKATVATVGNHGLQNEDICLITGSDQAEYNGEFRVTVLSATTFSIPIPNEASDVVTGSMSCRKAPLGFVKSYEAINKAVYRSKDLTSNRAYFRVVDDASSARGGAEAMVTMAENMTSTDSWDQLVPSPNRSPIGYCVLKSSAVSTAERHWMLIGDSKTFYMFIYFQNNDLLSGNSSMSTIVFGDFAPSSPTDAWATIIGAHPVSVSVSNNQPFNALFEGLSTPWAANISNTNLNGIAHVMVMRDYSGGIGGRPCQTFGAGANTSGYMGNTAQIPYPNGPDGGLYLTPMLLLHGDPRCIRGRMRGIYDSPHGRCFGNLDQFSGVNGFPDRKFMTVWGSSSLSSSCSIIIDITGPWE